MIASLWYSFWMATTIAGHGRVATGTQSDDGIIADGRDGFQRL